MADEKSKKVKKKVFYEVKTPLTAAKVSLYGSSPEDLNGRVVMLDLTRSLRGKSFILKMKVVNKEGNLEGEPQSLELAGSYIRRSIRKGTDYVEDSFIVDGKDGKFQVKPFMLTRNKVSRAVRRELRNAAKKQVESFLKVRTSSEAFIDLTTNKLQRELSLKLKKIYPLALCEIRSFSLVK